jgi:ketosteroid isomerase-like protein
MAAQTLSFEEQTEAIRQVYTGINGNDIPAAVAHFDPEIESIEPPDYPEAGTTRGLPAVTALFTRARATWAEGGCEPEQFVAAGDKVVVLVHVHVRLKDKTEWIDGHLGDVFTFRNGKIIEKRTFDEQHEALEWAGVDASAAS